MALAIALGEKGKGSTFPNPPVGAVLVKNGEVISTGWHRYRGEDHAEARCIDRAISDGHDPRGATLYVTLEPCCHHGLTPPCTDKIIETGIARVVISVPDDHDERVCGGGIKILNEAGIAVEVGLMADCGSELIEHYRIQRTEKRAFLTAKWAQSLDGRIAARTGLSKWISGEKARAFAHKLRSRHGAVAVGAGTVIADNPELTVRMFESHHAPVRIILAGDIVLNSSLKALSGGSRTIIVLDNEDFAPLNTAENVELLILPRGKGFWKRLLAKLPAMGIGSVLLEGGSEVLTSAFINRAIDRVYCIVAPMLMGDGVQAVSDLKIDSPNMSIRLEKSRWEQSDEDIIVTGMVSSS